MFPGLRNQTDRAPACSTLKTGLAGKSSALLVALVLFAALPAIAAPPPGTDPTSEMSEWYRGLRQPRTGFGCCSEADCHGVPPRMEGCR